MEVAICVITYQRPAGLARLLTALARLTFTEATLEVRIVVVDNDPQETARARCQSPPEGLPGPLEYCTERQRGIPFARNCAVRHALPRADCIVFIDDDEEPASDWLSELLRVKGACDAHVVAGPVRPRFAPDVPGWIRKADLFEHPRYRTGSSLTTVGTGNVLIDAQVFREMETHFDTAYALSGGSDTQFMHRVHLAGYRMVWADEAVVYEWIPRSRACTRWMLSRFYSNGTANGARVLEHRGKVVGAAVVLFQGAAHVAAGLALLPLALVRGRAYGLRYLRYVACGLGYWAGLAGCRPAHYRTIHGH